MTGVHTFLAWLLGRPLRAAIKWRARAHYVRHHTKLEAGGSFTVGWPPAPLFPYSLRVLWLRFDHLAEMEALHDLTRQGALEVGEMSFSRDDDGPSTGKLTYHITPEATALTRTGRTTATWSGR